MRLAFVAVSAPLLSGCITTIEQSRAIEQPRIVLQSKNFDATVGCISERIAGRFRMNYLPTSQGGAFHYDHGAPAFGGRSSFLVDVIRGDPVITKITITGGPWLGQDDLLIRRVHACTDVS